MSEKFKVSNTINPNEFSLTEIIDAFNWFCTMYSSTWKSILFASCGFNFNSKINLLII